MRKLFVRPLFLAVVLIVSMGFQYPTSLVGQGTNSALVRGTVTDSSGGVVPGATVTMTNEGTQVSQKATTDNAGRYIFYSLPPASYTATVEAQGFKVEKRPNIVLRVGDQTDLDYTLQVGTVTQVIEITSAAPLLNTVSGSLGAQVTNRYLSELPLLDRDISELPYLAPGVTEVQNARIGQLGGTVFASNGQHYATAEFRLDGALLSNPEGGEGGSSIVQYKPSVEDIQEFKLMNNGFSAEYGNNGGTVINIVTKSGTNKFHGAGWYFFRRPSFDANDFFSNRDCPPPGDPSRPPDGCKGAYAHDQAGGLISGPIFKDKTFFLFNFEKTRDNAPSTSTTSVPTALQRQGNFSQTFNSDGSLESIFNPYAVAQDPLTGDFIRQPFPGNVISGNCTKNQPDPTDPTRTIVVTTSCIDPIGQAIMNLYPLPTGPGDPLTGLNNYTYKIVEVAPGYQYDARIDHNFSEKSRIFGRYSRSHSTDTVPDPFLAANFYRNETHDVGLEHNWTLTPTLLWTNRISLHRGYFTQKVQPTVDPLSVGLPSNLVLNPWYNEKNFPDFFIDSYQGLVTNACCTDTLETDTQWMINSIVSKTKGGHSLKFGGEKRIFLNNFFQPDDTSGEFEFGQGLTTQSVFNPDFSQGNSLAGLLLGWADWGAVVARPHVANKSGETAFFVQDDWKVTSRLTLNLGLRYEWSTPYSERYNHNAFSCFSCDSGIFVPSLGEFTGREILGTTILATPSRRHADSDLNNMAPRFGFAYRLNDKTVLRGSAGLYYGQSYPTNWQYGGSAWNKGVTIYFSKDSGRTQYANLANPFPVGFIGPQQGKYGQLTLWGHSNGNHGSEANRNAEIYQWNFGIERELPGLVKLEVHYSASRATHLPWNYSVEDRNFVSRADREKWGSQGLEELVPNPFQYLFQSINGSTPIFNEPDSLYNDGTTQRINLLRPFPQFDGGFTGFPLFAASSSYHSLQVRFEKQHSHGLVFLGNYTFSKFIDDTDSGGNAWIGNLGFAGTPQDFTNRRAEKSVSANDTPHRLAFAVIYELPVGRGRPLGRQMNRALDGIVGGWRVSTNVALQTGGPTTFGLQNGRLADGTQRPNINGNACSGANVDAVVNGTANYFDSNAFAVPADQIPGTAGRYYSNCRQPGIHNLNFQLAKRISLRESMALEFRADFFNFLNTPRFYAGNTTFGSDSFGVIDSLASSSRPRHGQIGIRFEF